MRLKSFTDYSVCVLVYVAKKNGELASIREVSEVYKISSNHLMKVVHLLGKGGYLATIRGKNGGFRLGKAPKDINIGEIIRFTEDDLDMVVRTGDSSLDGEYHFADVVGEAFDAFLATVDKYSLEDLIQQQAQKKSLAS